MINMSLPESRIWTTRFWPRHCLPSDWVVCLTFERSYDHHTKTLIVRLLVSVDSSHCTGIRKMFTEDQDQTDFSIKRGLEFHQTIKLNIPLITGSLTARAFRLKIVLQGSFPLSGAGGYALLTIFNKDETDVCYCRGFLMMIWALISHDEQSRAVIKIDEDHSLSLKG